MFDDELSEMDWHKFFLVIKQIMKQKDIDIDDRMCEVLDKAEDMGYHSDLVEFAHELNEAYKAEQENSTNLD